MLGIFVAVNDSACDIWFFDSPEIYIEYKLK